MNEQIRDAVEDLRRTCADPDCPLSMTFDDLVADVPEALAWTKAALARDAIAISLRCGPATCCARPFLERVAREAG